MKHASLKIAAFVLALAVPAVWAHAGTLSVTPKTLALTTEDSTVVQVHRKWRKYRYPRYRYGHRHRYYRYGHRHRHYYGYRRYYGPSFSFGFGPYYPYYGGYGPSFGLYIR